MLAHHLPHLGHAQRQGVPRQLFVAGPQKALAAILVYAAWARVRACSLSRFNYCRCMLAIISRIGLVEGQAGPQLVS